MARYEQFCAVARAAEVLGERWTMLIVRELLLGPKRFADLQRRLAPIAPGILSGRLRALESRGLIERVEVAPPTPAHLFQLTTSGQALQPLMREALKWGARYLFPVRPGEHFEPEWLGMVLETYAAAMPSDAMRVGLEVHHGPATAQFVVAGGPGGTVVTAGDDDCDARISTDMVTLLGLMSGRAALDSAIESGRATLNGDYEIAARVSELFATDS